MIIYGKNTLLRAIERKDLELFRSAINSPELEHFETRVNYPVSTEQQEKWYEGILKGDSNNLRLVIEFEENAVGYTNILNIDWINRTAWTGIKMFETKYRGKGIGKDAVMAVMRYAFDVLNLNRLEGLIFSYNEPSYKLYIGKCGWNKEGVTRQCIFKDGEYHDAYYVSILNKEYKKLMNEIHYWE